MDSESIIRETYLTVLEREVDQEGLDTYIAHLDGGKTAYWLQRILKRSPEYKDLIKEKQAAILAEVRAKEKEYPEVPTPKTITSTRSQPNLHPEPVVQTPNMIPPVKSEPNLTQQTQYIPPPPPVQQTPPPPPVQQTPPPQPVQQSPPPPPVQQSPPPPIISVKPEEKRKKEPITENKFEKNPSQELMEQMNSLDGSLNNLDELKPLHRESIKHKPKPAPVATSKKSKQKQKFMHPDFLAVQYDSLNTVIVEDEESDEEFVIPAKRSLKQVVNIFMCVRNNAKELTDTLRVLRIIERDNLAEYEFRYYIMENDSTDDTPYQILDFYKYAKGQYKLAKYGKRQHGTTRKIDRVKDMAFYRNEMKNLCVDWKNSKYSFIVDTGVKFTNKIFKQLIADIEKTGGAMVASFGGIVNGQEDRYYDTYALETKDGTLGFPLYIQSMPDDFMEVNSCFGGFVIVKTEVLKECKWDAIDANRSEHNFFCREVQRHGKIHISKKTKILWWP